MTEEKLKEIRKTSMGKNIKDPEKLNIWIRKASSVSEERFADTYSFDFVSTQMRDFHKAVNKSENI